MLASDLTKDFETVTKTEMERRGTRRGNRSFCSNAEVFRRSVAYYHKKFNSIKPIHLKKECESPQNGQKGKNNGRRKENPLQNLPSGE